jgi:hypothetical protein
LSQIKKRILPKRILLKLIQWNALRPLELNEPGVAYGVISGFPAHDSYPVDDRENLDKLFREDYSAWVAMSRAAISRFANCCDAEEPIRQGPFSHYRVNGWWEYKGRRIVDNGFVLFGSSGALDDFMSGYNRPYVLKTELQTETVSLFSERGSKADTIYVGDLEDCREIISRVYNFLRPNAIFGTYTVTEFAGSFSHSWIDVFGNFARHIRQNGEREPIQGDSIPINDDRARAEIKLLDHPSLRGSQTTNRPTVAGILGLLFYRPKPLPLIDASQARDHLREHIQVRGRVTEIWANRRGDVILRFGSTKEVFKAIVPASCSLSKEQEWIENLKNRTLTVSGLISFNAQRPAMRILEKKSGNLSRRTRANLNMTLIVVPLRMYDPRLSPSSPRANTSPLS